MLTVRHFIKCNGLNYVKQNVVRKKLNLCGHSVTCK